MTSRPLAFLLPSTRRQYATLAFAAIVSLMIAALPAPAMGRGPLIGLAVVFATVSLFATGAVHGLTATAIFFVLALATDSAPVWTLVTGFWSNATLLILGGLVIGTAADRSGLGRYVARRALRPFLGSYPSLLLGIMLGIMALTFLVPSTMGRLAITLPIMMGVAKEVGYQPGSKGYAAVVLTVVAGNFLTAYGVFSGNLINVIAHGAAEAMYGRQVGYLEHLIYNGPVLGLFKGAMFLGMTLLLFPAPPPARTADEGAPSLGPDGRRLAVLLAMTVALWATDFLHGLKPGWVAVAGGIACLLPPIALMAPREMLEPNRLNAVLSVPAMLGLATVLAHSGAGALISDSALSVVPLQGRSAGFGFIAIGVVTAVVSILATTVGTVAIVTPLLGTVAAATGLPIQAGLVAEMAGLQCLFFHYEAVPIMAGTAIGKVSPGTAARLMVPLAFSGLLVVVPLSYLWLRLLGIAP